MSADEKLKARIAKARAVIKDATAKRAEIRAAGGTARTAPAKAKGKPKRAPARRKSGRSGQAQASA